MFDQDALSPWLSLIQTGTTWSDCVLDLTVQASQKQVHSMQHLVLHYTVWVLPCTETSPELAALLQWYFTPGPLCSL